jgi:hypothetical protein
MTDSRRAGDTRPFHHPNNNGGLRLTPPPGHPIRWLPRHGEPVCILEWIAQHLIKILAWTPVYIAVIVTLTLVVQIFGVPFVKGR